MASIFCPQCGAKNVYTLKKPNFCQGCGETFAAFGMASASAQRSSYSAAEPAQSETDEVPDISKFEYEIENIADAGNNKVTFQTLLNNPINPEEVTYGTKKLKNHKKLTPEEFVKVSQAECRSSRGDSKDIGGGGE